jgi:phenylpropionate dioxygenase-like ring-hydroxylating dioxygenase large terminal subunit
VVYATPIRKGECRLFARFPFKFSSKIPMILLKLTPRWYSHIKQNLILEDDQIFLHHQERYLEAQGGSSNFSKAFYLPTKADLFVLQLHTWVQEYSINPFAGKNLSPALPKEVLLDRYNSHTEKCRICRTALTNLKRARMGIAVVIVFIWALMPVLMSTRNIIPMIAYYIFMIIGVVAWLYLVNLEQKFYRGENKPPRNLKEN